jgi:hypothetical protein
MIVDLDAADPTLPKHVERSNSIPHAEPVLVALSA